MPELPDLEIFKRYLDSTALHRKITGVSVLDTRILSEISPGKLKSFLKSSSFHQTTRRGKYLFAGFGNGEDKEDILAWLIFHFGMTGSLKYYKNNGEDPEYSKIVISFENGYSLAYLCTRMLGKIGLTSAVDSYTVDIGLGPDAADVSFEGFLELFKGGRGAVKTALMNQNMIAGLGNIYTDEVLFQAGVHPQTQKDSLSLKTVRSLYTTMKQVLDTAVDRGAEPEKLPSDYIIPQRQKNGTCPKCGNDLKKITLGGRSTYFCPSRQKEPDQ